MAGRGPAPKPVDQRRRRNAGPVVTSVAADGLERGPDLPELAEGSGWPAATVRWWETWRRSPLAQTFTDTDWDFLLDTALLHAELWSGNAAVAAELRLRVAKFGATPEDRARLKLAVTEPDGKPAQARPASPDRKKRLLRVIDSGA